MSSSSVKIATIFLFTALTGFFVAYRSGAFGGGGYSGVRTDSVNKAGKDTAKKRAISVQQFYMDEMESSKSGKIFIPDTAAHGK